MDWVKFLGDYRCTSRLAWITDKEVQGWQEYSWDPAWGTLLKTYQRVDLAVLFSYCMELPSPNARIIYLRHIHFWTGHLGDIESQELSIDENASNSLKSQNK